VGRGSSHGLEKAGFGPKQESGPERLLIVPCERLALALRRARFQDAEAAELAADPSSRLERLGELDRRLEDQIGARGSCCSR
jgi:hypothetical protein